MPDSIRSDRENMEYDVVIVGAGPSGLACAIRLKQLDANLNVWRKAPKSARIFYQARSLKQKPWTNSSPTGKKRARP